MQQKARHKTTVTKEIILQVEELAKQGFNNILIGQSLNIATQTLSTNKELKEAIQRGKLELSKQVTSTILETLSTNATNQQFLVKRLGLFSQAITITKPSNTKEALENLANATIQFANGEISESQLRTIEAVSNSYTKSYEVIELEERIQALEESINNEK